MKIALVDDSARRNLLPLTYTRASFDLRVGLYTLRERVERLLGRVDVVFIEDYLADVYRERIRGVDVNPAEVDEDLLVVNGRLLVDKGLARLVKERVKERRYFSMFSNGELVAAYVPRGEAGEACELLAKRELDKALGALKRVGTRLEYAALLFKYPWELVNANSEVIASDFAELGKRGLEGDVDERAAIYGSDVYVAKEARVEAYAVLDAREGPIVIDEGARVAAGAVIEGPAYIGKGTMIVANALVREGCSIGEVCRVGGEIEETIIQGYSNKYHAGFIGHAYVGEWVNIGALTTNSDLKDTYGTVKVNVEGRKVDTGLRKVGCFLGDMAKTSIGTYIYTGKKVGVASHLHGVVYEDVPSFTIYAKSLGGGAVELYLESAIEIQRRMMSRRGKVLSKSEEELIRRLFELTEEERRRAGVVKGRFKL